MFNLTALLGLAAMAAVLAWPGAGLAQSVPEATSTEASSEDSQFLKVYFETGSARIGEDQSATLDRAARTFREGDPFVMIVAGGADTVGQAAANLELSLRRANAVAAALIARGIPAERLQVLGRGLSELEVSTAPGVAEARNRVVEISWR